MSITSGVAPSSSSSRSFEFELADLMADNRIAELAEIDSVKLAEAFEAVDTGAIPFEMTGYEESFYQELATALLQYGGSVSITSGVAPSSSSSRSFEFVELPHITLGGSGTTLAAAEKTGHTAYIMEITPEYTDVIVKRYFRTAGKDQIKLIRDGEALALRMCGAARSSRYRPLFLPLGPAERTVWPRCF